MEEINKPFISVIIPVYNAEKYVAKAIESALNQPEVAEVIIVNDGSKDDSLAICRAYAKKKTNIRVTHHKNNKNRGIAASRNLGVKLSNYDWVAFLDADDYYLETRFKFDAQLIKSDNTLDAVYSNSQYYNLTTKEYGEVRELKDFENPFRDLVVNDKVVFHTNAITIRKTALNKAGGFEERLGLCEDTQLWFKLALVAKIKFNGNQSPLAIIVEHGENTYKGKTYSYRFLGGRFLMWYYAVPFILKYATLEQQKLFFNIYLFEYKIYYRLLNFKQRKKWFNHVFIKQLSLFLTPVLIRNHRDFLKEFKQWYWKIFRRELVRKRENIQASLLKFIPRSIKEKIKSTHDT